MKFNNNEEAVSPVIGVILMVAITVILAAVIAVFVFGMADDIQGTHVVSVTSKMVNDTAVVLTFQGGADTGSVVKIMANVTSGGTDIVKDELPAKVGSQVTLQKDTATSLRGNRLLVIATFNDGATQILTDKIL